MTDAGVPCDDRGLTLGVGLFETILFVRGEPRLWAAHLARLHRGCTELALPLPQPATLAEAAGRAVGRAGLGQGRAAVRLTWTGGSGARGLAAPDRPRPRLLASAGPAPEPPLSLSLATSRVRRNPSSPTSRLKTLSYLDGVVARGEAMAAGADEALCLDVHGRIACAAAGNVFWVEGGRLCTPSLSCGVLPGVVRAEALRRASAFGLAPLEVEAEPARLREADAAFVTNSLIGAAAVRSLDGADLPPPEGATRNLCARLRADGAAG